MVVELNHKNKQIVWDFWRHLESANPDQLPQAANKSLASKINWRGPDPINELHGVQSFVSDFWMPLTCAVPVPGPAITGTSTRVRHEGAKEEP